MAFFCEKVCMLFFSRDPVSLDFFEFSGLCNHKFANMRARCRGETMAASIDLDKDDTVTSGKEREKE